jgi:WD repeat-containing protein 35
LKSFPGRIDLLITNQGTAIQRAEIAAHFGSFADATKMYNEIDRMDLALDLRARLGDWTTVIQLLKTSGSVSDKFHEKSWNEVADHYFDRKKWQAFTFELIQSNNVSGPRR